MWPVALTPSLAIAGDSATAFPGIHRHRGPGPEGKKSYSFGETPNSTLIFMGDGQSIRRDRAMRATQLSSMRARHRCFTTLPQKHRTNGKSTLRFWQKQAKQTLAPGEVERFPRSAMCACAIPARGHGVQVRTDLLPMHMGNYYKPCTRLVTLPKRGRHRWNYSRDG